MVRIEQGPVWSRMTQASPEVVRAVYDALAVDNPQARFARTYRRGQWDGTVKFLLRPHNRFLTGLTQRVVKLAGEIDPEVVVVPVRVPDRPPLAPSLKGIDLRDHQVEAVRAFEALGRRGTIQVPTGGGKTEIALEIIRALGHNTLWLTHLKDLHAQTVERARLRLPGLTVGEVGYGKMDPKFPLTVAMVPTLKNIPEGDPFWDAWRFVVFDECHHASAMTWFEAAKRLRYAPMRLALSGTATTKDKVRDMRLEGVAGPIVRVVSSVDLVEAGYLAKPTIRLLRPQKPYPVGKDFPGTGAQRYAAVYDQGIMLNQERNFIAARVAVNHAREGEKVLVLCRRIPHGNLLERSVRADRVQWVHWLSGQEDGNFRVRVLGEFQKMSNGGVLIASTIFDEGMDIPEVDCLVLAGGGQSAVKTIQRVGRALRPRKDKQTVVIYDFLDGRCPVRTKGERFTYDDYLAKHSKERVRDYQAEGFDIEWPK
jgi:Herelleviridae DNA helicase